MHIQSARELIALRINPSNLFKTEMLLVSCALVAKYTWQLLKSLKVLKNGTRKMNGVTVPNSGIKDPGIMENENEELQRLLAEMQCKRNHIELLRNAEVFKLQIEVDFLFKDLTQLHDKYRQDRPILQNKFPKNEIFENKNVEYAEARSFSEQNITEKDESKVTENHPVFVHKKKKKKIPFKKLLDLEIGRGEKRRKLFHEDKDAIIDI